MPAHRVPLPGPFLLALALAAAAPRTAAEEPTVLPPLTVTKTTGPIVLDGKLDDEAWRQAAVIDTFFETHPGENVEPKVKTLAYLTYDERFFYVGIHAFDPEPAKIRAPYVERDKVMGTDDNVALFLDTRNDRRS